MSWARTAGWRRSLLTTNVPIRSVSVAAAIDGHRRDRRELLDQVIRDDERGEADRLGSPGGGGQRGAVDDGLEGGQESERSEGIRPRPDGSRSRRRRGFRHPGGTVVP